MKDLILNPTDISQWYALVNEAQASTQLMLNENTESYLVFLLQRFSQTPQLLESVVALDFLESMHIAGKQQVERLRTVGDKSLLLCGLFPGVATRRHVTLDYYTGMGQAAYLTISELQDKRTSELFLQLSEYFVSMQKILQAMRGDFYQFEHKASDSFALKDDSHLH
jgi:hypothetical protein